MEEQRTLRREPAGCTATGLLKLLALVFMFADHSGKMVFGNMTELRMLGRLAFPIYCWCLAVGAHYTRSFPKYLLRLLALYALSQPLYMVALNHSWAEPNIFLTLAVAVLGLWGLREQRYGSHIWAPLLALVLAELLDCNYGWTGVLLVFLMYLLRDSRVGLGCMLLCFCMYWGSSSSTLHTVFGMDLSGLTELPFGDIFKPFVKLQTWALLSLPLILWRPPERLAKLRLPKWVGYGLYPAHLLLLLLLEGLQTNGWTAVYHRLMGLAVNPVLSLLGLR